MNQGNKAKAEEEFKQELSINPNYDKALNNLENLLK
jgi:Tfp pilus assembly protein PilF